MSDCKVFNIPDAPSNHGSIDPALLMALNNNGGFGGNGNWIWIFFLWFLWPMMQNGMWGNGMFGNGNGACANGFGGLANMLNNDTGRELLMQAIQGNASKLDQLASMFGCSKDTILQAINGVTSQIQAVGDKVGMSGMQTINAIQQGDCQIRQQLAECCCENRLAICQQTNTLQNAINNVATGQERGFANLGFLNERQTCDLKQTISDSTSRIVEGQRAAEMREMQNKLDAVREENSTFKAANMTSQIVGQAVAPILTAVNGLQREVDGIKCKLPETATVPYSPVVGVPACQAFNAFSNGFGWNAFNNGGCCGGNNFWF